MRDIQTKLALMREVAAAKVNAAGNSPEFLRLLESHLDNIGLAKAANMAPINENLLGIAYMLLFAAKAG